MKNKKWYLMLVIMLMGAMLLTACGGPDAAEETAEEPQATEESTTEENAEETMEEETTAEETAVEEFDVSLTIWADDTRAPVLLDLAEDFQAAYQVGLVVEQVAEIRDQFVIAAPAGEGPDIIIGAHDWLGQLVTSGLLAPMDLGAKADEFTEVSLQGFTYEGQLYGMPYAVENLAFFYNTDLVSEPPTSWDEVVTVGTALQESGDVTYGFGLTGTTYDAFPLQSSFGGYIFGQDENGNYDPTDVGVDSEGMIAAGEWIAARVSEGFMSDNTDWDTTHALFETGEIPFLMAGPWALDRIRESGTPYAIATFPDDGRPFVGVQGFMVNALSENVLLAQTFLTEFVATPETMEALYLAGNRPSAYASVLEATEDTDIAAFRDAGTDAVLMPAIPEMGSVWGSWGDAFSLIIQGEQTANDALTNGGQQIRELIGGAAAGMVNVPGSWQSLAGCGGDWDPACEATALTQGDDGLYTGSFAIPAGDYETKVALDGGWTVNYGVDGKQDGDNYTFTLDTDSTVTFTYDPETNLLDISSE